ncbi:cobalamin B12-binding domain-containing protein, partial [Candidatus Woesearchaeota archaeon]|nr:cobalamin B12-binding domain-containing protein [Candidatus Woesearchaeota archaeon]
MMKILLMDSPYAVFTGYYERYFAPGMASLAAVLRQAGHEVAIFEADTLRQSDDLDFTSEYLRLQAYIDGLNDPTHWIWKEICKVVEGFRPDLVGITAVTMKFGSTVRVAELCKQYNPRMKVIVGGPHATDWPQMSLQSPAVDFNVAGEAEDTILLLIKAIEAGSENYDKIPGLTYRQNGGIVVGSHPKPPRDLDRFPYPARDLLM